MVIVVLIHTVVVVVNSSEEVELEPLLEDDGALVTVGKAVVLELLAIELLAEVLLAPDVGAAEVLALVLLPADVALVLIAVLLEPNDEVVPLVLLAPVEVGTALAEEVPLVVALVEDAGTVEFLLEAMLVEFSAEEVLGLT